MWIKLAKGKVKLQLRQLLAKVYWFNRLDKFNIKRQGQNAAILLKPLIWNVKILHSCKEFAKDLRQVYKIWRFWEHDHEQKQKRLYDEDL